MNASLQPKNKGPKACMTCAKAKARCMPGPEGGNKCERCCRLDKPCLLQTPAPPRVRKSPKLSKVAALERRLEELSSQVNQESANNNGGDKNTTTASPPKEQQLDAGNKRDQWTFGHIFPTQHPIVTRISPEQQPATTTSTTSTPTLTPTSTLISTATSISVPTSNPIIGQASAPTPTPTPTSTVQSQSWDIWWLTPSHADTCLANFISAHSGLFPFVLVPHHITAQQLKQDRPFTWKAVMMIGCSLDGARQVQLGQDLLADISKAAIVDGIKSLDLLQGLQMLVAWFHYALKGAQITNLLFLARSMCMNLCIKDDLTLQGQELTHNLDCMRAYAGTYYLNTLVLTTNKRPDVLMNTNFLETCCRAIETNMEHPSDEYLVKLVRVQQLAQSISLTMTFDNLTQQAMNLPLTIVVRSFQDQLDQFSSTLGRYAENATLRCHVCVAQILLYEFAISDQHSTASFVPLTDRLQLLWACLRSLKSFFDIRFAHRELERPRFLCLSASDYVYALITGLKLMMLQLPGWNHAHLQGEIDMVEVMDQQSRDMVIIIAQRKQGLFPDAPPLPNLAEDPFESMLYRLGMLRDSTKQELERLDAGTVDVDVPVLEIHSDFLNASTNDFWQGFGGPEIWRLIGDPSIVYTSNDVS